METFYNQYRYRISPCINNSTFNGMKKLLSDDEILHIMKKHNFSEENFIIMSGDEKAMGRINPQLLVYNEGEKERSDIRTPVEYKMGICASWVIEDFNMDRCNEAFRLMNVNAKIELNGGDKDRIVVCSKESVSTDADFLLIFENTKIQIEHCISYSGYFIREHQITLRKRKYHHLKENNSLIMAIETFGSRDKIKWKYALIGGNDLASENFTYQSSCGKFHKSGGQLHISKDWFMAFDDFCKVLLNYAYFCNKNRHDNLENNQKDMWIDYLRKRILQSN